MPGYNRTDLIATGANTNQTSASKAIPVDADFVAFRCVCEAIGATPAINWQIFGALDDPATVDGSSFWEPIGYITDGAGGSPDTVSFVAKAGPIVAGTAQSVFPSTPNRKYRKYRCAITGILNVTYRVEMWATDVD
jgi:hypothetical protein